MSRKKAIILYFIISSIGLIIGFLLSLSIANKFTILLFIIPVILLYWYAVRLKKSLFVGNLVISLLVAFSLLIIVFFESHIVSSFSNMNFVLIVIFFAFTLNLIREIIKDAQDIIGDKYNGVISIPIKYGSVVTKWIIYGIVILFTGVLITVMINQYQMQNFLIIYFLLAVLGGMLVFTLRLNKAKNCIDYGRLSKLLKRIMILGIISIFMIKPF